MNRVAQHQAQDRAARRALIGAVGMTLAVGVVTCLAGVTNLTAALVLAGAAVAWLAFVGLRRELRIRRRLADPRTRPAPIRAAETSTGAIPARSGGSS